jgi:pimeloyl-ACP methyl ester carboxylesterase
VTRLAAAAVALVVLAVAARPARSADDPCIASGETAVTLKASDGARVHGIEVGKGTTGVVLGHQFLSDHCEFMFFARELAQKGYRALAIDFRGYGQSRGGDGRRLDRDVAAAVARLRADGATKIKLVGASMGGTAVLTAASWIKPAVDGVVSLSGPANYRGLDALRAVKTSRVPVRFLAARGDRSFAADARTLAHASKARDKKLALYPGGVHGSSLLGLPAAEKLVVDFLAR